MSQNAWCPAPSMMVGMIWVDDRLDGGGKMDSCGGVSSRCKHRLTLLGGMSRLSTSLDHNGCQMLG
jgi:hypothetical protein